MEKVNAVMLSTACIGEGTAHLLSRMEIWREKAKEETGLVVYDKGGYGWFIFIGYAQKENIPEDLKRCIDFAAEKGCQWLIFDSDCNYDEKDGLEKHEW